MQLKPNSDLYQFIARESPQEVKRIIGLAFFVGVVNTGLIALVNFSAASVSDGESVVLQFFLFALLLAVYLLITKRANTENITSTQSLIHKFKMRIMAEVFRSELTKVDEVGRVEILQILARDSQTVSQSVIILMTACQSIATLFFLTLYMATISMTAFFIILVSSLVVFFAGSRALRTVTDDLEYVWKREAVLNDLFADFLNGYKEVKMNSRRAFELTHDMVTQGRETGKVKAGMLIFIANFFNYLHILLYVVVGMMIFVVPVLSTDFSTSVTQASTTALFLAASLSGIIQSIPTLTQANAAARALHSLEERLLIANDELSGTSNQVFEKVQSLEFKEVAYKYPVKNGQLNGQRNGQAPFQLGPISCEFKAGQVYFIRGNNGSGKTTFIRLLTGLCQPDAGVISVNNGAVSLPANSNYRDIFSVVFTDFYLFRKLYGIQDATPEEIDSLLELFEMHNKVSVKEGAFSRLNFSTGQRKRLALLVALLEKRQVIILDEWAADQDPTFRRQFYEEIIPTLRDRGHTVIAITHDDQYYHCADQMLYLVEGQLTAVES
jgi:putative ATP-binding cassette transporter